MENSGVSRGFGFIYIYRSLNYVLVIAVNISKLNGTMKHTINKSKYSKRHIIKNIES